MLARVPRGDAFWLCTNENLLNLASLAISLEKADDDVFRYHVTRDKNDFETWIRDVVGDKDLAREIARVKTKETLIRKINERLILLKKTVKRHRDNALRRKARKAGKMKKRGMKKTGKTKKRVTKKGRKAKRRVARTAGRTRKVRTKRKVRRPARSGRRPAKSRKKTARRTSGRKRR